MPRCGAKCDVLPSHSVSKHTDVLAIVRIKQVGGIGRPHFQSCKVLMCALSGCVLCMLYKIDVQQGAQSSCFKACRRVGKQCREATSAAITMGS